MMRTSPLRWLLPAVAMLAAGGCNRVQSVLLSSGDQASAAGGIWNLMLWVCVPIYVFVLIALALAMRRRPTPAGTTRDRAIGRGLAAWLALVGALLTVLVTASFLVDRRINRVAVAPLQIRVTAHQWWWDIQYLDPDVSKRFSTANELHLPVDRDTRIELASADVIHSFWVPSLSGKLDLIPGRTNAMTLTPRRVGWYRGQCAEFCGLQHAHMALDVRVDNAAGFAAWRAQQLAAPQLPLSGAALAGEHLFESSACAMCHAVAGTIAGGHGGPDLTHLASRRMLAAGTWPMDRDHLDRWIADPQKPKPGALMPAVPLDPRDRAAIDDYLMGLR
ncbi:MAG TPA: cytochrome c oxidase subunit II [Rudaea sp.]